MTPWLTPPRGPAATLTAQFAALVPELETTRLRLRAPRIQDFAAYRDISRSDRWPHSDGRIPTDEEAWLDFNQMLASWLLRGIGLFSVETRRDGALIGFACLDHEWGDPDVEIGWMLCAGAERQGYATEAARAVLHFTATQARASVVSYMGLDHPRSHAVAERLGGTRDAVAEAALGQSVFIYRHDLKDTLQ